MRIFVVESDGHYRDLIKSHLLEISEYEVRAFNDWDSFFLNLSENPDVVIFSCSMPEISSHLAIEKIQSYNPQIQILITGDCGSDLSFVTSLEYGVYDVIYKEDDIKERLLNSLRNIKTASTTSYNLRGCRKT